MASPLRRLDIDQLFSLSAQVHSLKDSVDWLEKLLLWIRRHSWIAGEFGSQPGQVQVAKIKFLIFQLGRNEDHRRHFCRIMHTVLKETSTVQLFSQLGLSQEHGFFAEAVHRLLRRLLPVPHDVTELSDLFATVFTSEADVEWIKSVPAELILELIEILKANSHGTDPFSRLKTDTDQALLVLASTVAGLGVSLDLRSRLSNMPVEHLPFVRLARKIQDTILNRAPWDEALYQDILECRQAIAQILKHLENSGVSVKIVYRLEVLQSCISRITYLITLKTRENPLNFAEIARNFTVDLVKESLAQRTLRKLISENLRLLSRKIVEHTGQTGEHYITRNKAEYFAMFRSALGGGFFTAFTSYFKMVLGHMSAPLFFEGFLVSLNYSVSFVILQMNHLTLATKQPSMTASALASTLQKLQDTEDVQAFVDEVARITRSQVAAVIGNLSAVVPTACLFYFTYDYFIGHGPIPEEYAVQSIDSLNPFTTLTVFYAALTGFILWFASVAGGWFENWIMFRRLPEALAQSRRLQFLFGENGASRIGKWLLHQCGGLAHNIVLGFLLGFVPILGRFFGFPSEVRHVTLSAGVLTLSACTLGFKEAYHWQIIYAVIGIFIIGVVNVGVSFTLALIVASRARDIDQKHFRKMISAVLARFLKAPFDFLLPKGI